MKLLFLIPFLTSFTIQANAALIEGTCTQHDSGLKWLSKKLSSQAIISCKGSSWQKYNLGRYWGTQIAKNASVVIFPACAQDVSYAVQASQKSPLGADFAFVSGGHGVTGAATSSGYIIDLTLLNNTQIIDNYVADDKTFTAVAYQGGANWLQINTETAGSGWTAVGARISSVGAGGFSTGGGIGFLAGAYGYAIDRLRAMEVVLLSGQIVLATKANKYKDLFWALQGGGGQFGIVTTFYQEAALEPTGATFQLAMIDPSSSELATQNVVDFFATNNDPYALIYYALGFFPQDLSDPNPAPESFGMRQLIACVYFPNPTAANGSQLPFSQRFAPLLSGLTLDYNITYSVPYSELTEQLDGFFPYGFRRGFYGPQTTNLTADYLSSITNEFGAHIQTVLNAGDFPATALWAVQYMHPGLNGHLPPSASSTSWPHNVAGHQTLFSPAWMLPSDDSKIVAANDAFNNITWQHQASVGPFIADYPNYIGPGVSGSRVWGGNVQKLMQVKQKYDPNCRIHNGRVFASKGCVAGGWANIFAS